MEDNPPTLEEPLSDEQLALLYAALRVVMNSPHGEGTVTITVKNHCPRLIHPCPALDFQRHIDRDAAWLRRDQAEQHT